MYPDPMFKRPGLGVPFVMLVVAALPLWPVLTIESPIPFWTRALGAALWAACIYPAWTYARLSPDQRPPMPFVAVIGLLYAFYFARPLILGQYNQHWRIRLDPTVDYNFPAQLALEGWVALLIGFSFGRKLFSSRNHDVVGAYDANKLATAALIMVAAGAVSAVLQQSVAVPLLVAGLTRFITAIGMFGIGLLAMLSARRELRSLKKLCFIVLVSVPLLIQVMSGFVSGALVIAAVVFLSVWIGRGKITLTMVLAALLIGFGTLMLKSVVGDFRRVAWIQGKDISFVDRADLVLTIAQRKIDAEGWVGTLGSGTFSTTKRSANLDLLADIVRRTPEPIPYWRGGSYLSLVGLAIPRFLWPDKPTKELGQRFGHRYSILDETDYRTSFNLPFLVEFYANFGEIGIILGMFAVGIIYRIIQNLTNRPGTSRITAIAGLVLVLPLLNIESDFSLTFGGLLMDGIALWYVLRKVQQRVIVSPVRSSEGVGRPGAGARLAASPPGVLASGIPRVS